MTFACDANSRCRTLQAYQGQLDLASFVATLLNVDDSDNGGPGLVAGTDSQKVPLEVIQKTPDLLCAGTNLNKDEPCRTAKTSSAFHAGQTIQKLKSKRLTSAHGDTACLSPTCRMISWPLALMRSHVARVGVSTLRSGSDLPASPQAAMLWPITTGKSQIRTTSSCCFKLTWMMDQQALRSDSRKSLLVLKRSIPRAAV